MSWRLPVVPGSYVQPSPAGPGMTVMTMSGHGRVFQEEVRGIVIAIEPPDPGMSWRRAHVLANDELYCFSHFDLEVLNDPVDEDAAA